MREQLRGGNEESFAERQISAGRVFFLTSDSALIEHQLAGGQLINVPQNMLIEQISTDEIIPNRACLAYTGTETGYLGNHVLTGLRGGLIKPGEVVAANFKTLVAGPSFARGSSRIHAPMALSEAGINIVVADVERIFLENCVNSGIYVLSPKTREAKDLLEGKTLSEEDIIESLTPMGREIMRTKGLLSYLDAIEKGKIEIPAVSTRERLMTMAEKIIARQSVNNDGSIGKVAVKPGDEVVAIPDQYYGYELQSGPMRKALEDAFGENVRVKNPSKVRLYNDHTALFDRESSRLQQMGQTLFATPLGITVYETFASGGVPAICHTDMVENHALPGQLILGNDSHTDTLGVLNNLAIGKGAIDLAGAIAYDRMVIEVPETIRINLSGRLADGVTMKDFMLQVGARAEFKPPFNIGSGKVFEFGGEALDNIPFDEQIKLTNMSIELQGLTGIIEPNLQMVSYLKEKRGVTANQIEQLFVRSDEGAQYVHVFDIDLSTIEPTVAEPGDTQNGKPLSEIRARNIFITKAYIGSCTHGTPEDLKQAAEVIRGRKVKEGVKFYIQASSVENLKEATEKGYIKDLIDAGAELLLIGCGACMNAGPGSTEKGEVAIFATNRNFPGRTGQGETYLASPAVVAASAVKGVICGPDSLGRTTL